MQGKLNDYRDIHEDDIYETIICVAQTNLIPETPAPNGYFNLGVLGPELHLAEGLFDLTRSAHSQKKKNKNNFYLYFFSKNFQLLSGTFQGHLSSSNNRFNAWKSCIS